MGVRRRSFHDLILFLMTLFYVLNWHANANTIVNNTMWGIRKLQKLYMYFCSPFVEFTMMGFGICISYRGHTEYITNLFLPNCYSKYILVSQIMFAQPIILVSYFKFASC